jgi:hypothetical protein
MNVLFKCCQCNNPKGEKRMIIHSYSWNKSGANYYLCSHFPEIELSWKTKYGFFTLGWKVEIFKVYAKCGQCKKWIYFPDQTFNSKNNKCNFDKDCCDHVIIYSAREGYFSFNDDGLKRKERINQQIKEIKAAEEKLKKLKEEAKKLEKEEKLRREKEEEVKKEKEKKRRRKLEKENKELCEIINQQEEEEKQLNKRINADTSWIEKQMSEMITEADVIYSNNNNFDAQRAINANYKCQMGKS